MQTQETEEWRGHGMETEEWRDHGMETQEWQNHMECRMGHHVMLYVTKACNRINLLC